MKIKLLLAAVLLLLPSPSFAQSDQINMQGARVFASPGDMMRWPIACTITAVTFTDQGFPTRGDCMDGPNRWPDVTPEGWDGPIQFTLGMCLLAPDHQWECSAVVQMWYGRQDKDPNATTAPYAVGSNWFYAAHMMGGGGSLTDRNPLPGERVGIFVVRGNGRIGTEYTKVHERSNVVEVLWGQDYRGVSQPQQPQQPSDPQSPGQPQQPGQPKPSEPVDMSDIRTLLQMSFRSEAAERMFADIVARMVAHEKQTADMQAELDARIDRNGLETFLKDKRVQAVGMAVIGFFSARSQTLGSGQPVGTSSAVAAASGLAILAAR